MSNITLLKQTQHRHPAAAPLFDMEDHITRLETQLRLAMLATVGSASWGSEKGNADAIVGGLVDAETILSEIRGMWRQASAAVGLGVEPETE